MRSVLLFVALCGAFVISGDSAYVTEGSCGMGPLYWCSQLKTAMECNAVERCLPLWRKKVSLTSSEPSVLCHMSEIAILAIKSSMEEKRPLMEVLPFAPDACAQLTRMNPKFASMCKNITRDHLLTVVTLLQSGVRPKVIAELMGHCDAEAMKSITLEDLHIQPLRLQSKENNKHVRVVKSKLEDVPAMKTFTPIVKALPQKQKETPSNSIECSACTRVMSYIDQFLTENSTETEVEAVLEKVCEFLPATVKNTCDHLIEQYTPILIRMFVADFPPVKICQFLGMCPAKAAKKAQTVPLQQSTRGIECELCVRVLTYVDLILDNDVSEKAIIAALDTVCNFVPNQREQCVQLVEHYTPLIIQFLTEQFTPADICQMISICPTARLVKKQTFLPPKPKKIGSSKDSLQCTLCVHVFNYVDSFLESNSTETEIEQALEKVCSFLPSSLQTECDAIIEQYTPVLIQLIVAEFTPHEICYAIGLCASKTQKLRHYPLLRKEHSKPQLCKKENKVSGALECAVCVKVFSYVETVITRNATEAEIERVLDEVCTIVPGTYRAKCDAFIHKYTPVLVQLILSKFTPREICHAIGECDSVKKLSVAPKQLKALRPQRTLKKTPVKDLECSLCIHTMNYVDSFITKNSTVREIEMQIERICNFLPQNMRADCGGIVEHYTPAIIQLILAELTPIQVCKAIKLCPQTKAKIQKFYYSPPTAHPRKPTLPKKCTEGPRFWCRTVESAKECGIHAMLVCHRNFWKN